MASFSGSTARMTGVDELLVLLEDARLCRNTGAVARLGAEVAEGLGVRQVGADELAGVAHRMRWCWPGRFLTGPDPEDVPEDMEQGPFPVDILRGFWIGETPVTQALWIAVMGGGDNPSHFVGRDRPVESVTWHEAVACCERLCLSFPRLGFRLPTEPEWEYAARAGTTTATYVGGTDWIGDRIDPIAWYQHNSTVDGEQGTQAVGRKAPNPWGLFDVLGNVNEWCHGPCSSWDPDTTWPPAIRPGTQAFRGGSWFASARQVSAIARHRRSADHRFDIVGFRLAAAVAGV